MDMGEGEGVEHALAQGGQGQAVAAREGDAQIAAQAQQHGAAFKGQGGRLAGGEGEIGGAAQRVGGGGGALGGDGLGHGKAFQLGLGER